MSEADKDESAPNQGKKTRTLILIVVVVICFIVALTVGLVLHFNLRDDDDDDEPVKRVSVIVDCYPELKREKKEMEKNKEDCTKRGCKWQKQVDDGAPWCIFPQDYGYRISSDVTDIPDGKRVEITRNAAPPPYDTEVFDKAVVDVEMQTDNRVRVKIYPKDRKRWEIPPQALDIESTNSPTNASTALYNVTFADNPFGVVVTRMSTGVVIFNTTFPGTILADQFMQITTRLASESLYGFGEHRHKTFRHDMNWRTWSMFTRDNGPNNDWNLYGHHPVYMNVEMDKKANMVLLKNTNAMEVALQPDPEPAVTFRTIGGVLDFYIFLGDSPADVVKHYIKAIGQPVFPPYWSFGYHLSRWGFTNISDMRAVIDRNRAAGIPYDAQWADIDTFHKAYVFTYSKEHWDGFPALVDDLKAHDQHFITIVDPGIGANQTIIQEVKADFPAWDITDDGERAGIYVKDPSNNNTLYAKVWPGITAFPDYTNDDVQDWWTKWIRYYRDTIGVKVEALWIDMNEPASFVEGSVNGCEHNKLNYPPYAPNVDGAWDGGKLYGKTLCMDANQAWGLHYDVHSLYGHTMAQRTHKSLEDIFPGKRPWTMTRASYVGTGHYATKWQGDNRADWSNMHYSIISLMEFGMFGFPMNGADICGFWLEPSFELCVRWHQLGAFYPFARDHNGQGDLPHRFKIITPKTTPQHQDPAAFGQDFVDLVKPVLLTRYKFLPYLYTVMYRAHQDGEMAFKPLFFEFPEDEKALGIDKQFMLGRAFLITPVMTEGAREVTAYFPKGKWFDYLTGESIHGPSGDVTLDTPLEKYNLHIREGHIIPWQEPDVTTAASRGKPLGLLVVLNDSGVAQGELYWDDGESKISENPRNYNIIKFVVAKAGELIIEPMVRSAVGVGSSLKFETIEIYGLPRLPQKFFVNSQLLPSDKVRTFNQIVKLVSLPGLTMTGTHNITWSLF